MNQKSKAWILKAFCQAFKGLITNKFSPESFMKIFIFMYYGSRWGFFEQNTENIDTKDYFSWKFNFSGKKFFLLSFLS